MKNLIVLFIIQILVLSSCNFGLAQENPSEKQQTKMLMDFYTAYITEVAMGKPPNLEKNLSSLRQNYCTLKLLKEIPKKIEETNVDPFIKAQDISIETLKTLCVVKVQNKPDSYTVSYTNIYSKAVIIIAIEVVKVKKGYKINSVN